MRALSVFVAFALAVPAFAATQDAPYQDAVLKSFRIIADAESCHTTGSSTSSASGNDVNTSGNATTNCDDRKTAHYTIEIGGQTLVLEPTLSFRVGPEDDGESAVLFIVGRAKAVVVEVAQSPRSLCQK